MFNNKGKEEVKDKSLKADEMALIIIGGAFMVYCIPHSFPQLSFITLDNLYSLGVTGVVSYGFFLVFDKVKDKIVKGGK